VNDLLIVVATEVTVIIVAARVCRNVRVLRKVRAIVTLADMMKMDAIMDYLIRRVLLDLPLDVGEVGDAVLNCFIVMSRHVVTGTAVWVTGTIAKHVAWTSLSSC